MKASGLWNRVVPVAKVESGQPLRSAEQIPQLRVQTTNAIGRVRAHRFGIMFRKEGCAVRAPRLRAPNHERPRGSSVFVILVV